MSVYIKVTLLYPPAQSWPGTMCKPNGSLAYPNLGGALLAHDVEVVVFDAAVGNDADDLQKTFYEQTPLASGLLRTGVTDERVLSAVADSHIVGITSIFTDQETMVLEMARLIKHAYPEKLIITGGVNARSRLERFLDAGVDVVCLSEAEHTLQEIAAEMGRGGRDFCKLSAVAFRRSGETVINKMDPTQIVWDLDTLPMPAWHLLPNERYWAIARPHGGHFTPGEELRYGSMMTSLGCVFQCRYCHIAGETVGSLSGEIGRFRVKSQDRVMAEVAALKEIGVKQVFVEDDTLLGMKRRAIDLLRLIKGEGLDIIDVNGVNVVHLMNKNEPDAEVLEALVGAGFREIVLPFESGTQRVLRKYATNKWDTRYNIQALIRMCKDYGLTIAGNYMLGYPDESRQEIERTIEMAKEHMAAGLDSSNFFLVMPLPGTPLFESAIAEGYLPADWNPDRMNWTKANMINTEVPPQELEELRDRAWREINSGDYVAYKSDMAVS